MLTAIVGINWGDEGKGRMVDLLSEKYDVIIRYQGGNNAGHTVVNNRGKFILNLMPSGILRDGTVNVMGPGMVVDIQHMCGEIDALRKQGIEISPENLKLSTKAVICMPYHKQLDILEEDRLGDAKFGSTRRGIGPVYGDKYMKKTIRAEDLLHPETLENKLKNILEWKNLTVQKGYGAPAVSLSEMLEWLKEYGEKVRPFICDTTVFLSQKLRDGANIMFEAQLGALRDIDYGIYPFTSSSSVIAAYAPIGSGIPFARTDNVIGIIKAYSTAVGEGPFVAEMFGEEANALREAGNEYGAATGRPRRVGGFDAVASKYGCLVQGATELAVTKLDVLSGMEKIPVCTAYDVDGEIIHDFVTGDKLNKAKPVYDYLPGFGDVSHCRTVAELPENARNYIKFIENAVGVPVKYISVGAERENCIFVDRV